MIGLADPVILSFEQLRIGAVIVYGATQFVCHSASL